MPVAVPVPGARLPVPGMMVAMSTSPPAASDGHPQHHQPDDRPHDWPGLSEPLPQPHGEPWRNRFALAPLTNTQSHPDGTLSDDERRWLVARGTGGFGLVMTAAAYVAPAGQAWGGQLGIASDDHLPGLARLAEELRATGTTSSVQLHHGGRRSDPRLSGRPNQCPWDDPEKDAVAMTTGEVEAMVEDFVAAAVRAERAGFDGVQLHGAHGYLLGQFLDARHNDRTDRYGGDLEGRMRPLLEVVQGVRAATGPGFQLGVRLTPEGNGISLQEGVETARRLLDSDLLDHLDMSLWDVTMRPRTGADGLLIEHFARLPRRRTALGVAGGVTSAADAAWCREQGADFVTVGTGAILHNDFAARALGDPDFRVRERPVSREELRAESVGEAFLDYLAAGWDDLVA